MLSQIFTWTYNKIQLAVYLIEAILMITHKLTQHTFVLRKIKISSLYMQIEHRYSVDIFIFWSFRNNEFWRKAEYSLSWR